MATPEDEADAKDQLAKRDAARQALIDERDEARKSAAWAQELLARATSETASLKKQLAKANAALGRIATHHGAGPLVDALRKIAREALL